MTVHNHETPRRPEGFNTEFTQAAMERVFVERGRQVGLGLSGRIPYACEDSRTADIYRLGVLGEEFGEICTAIIERQGPNKELEEYIHTAAVALACAEGIMAKLDYGDPSEGTDDSQASGSYMRKGVTFPNATGDDMHMVGATIEDAGGTGDYEKVLEECLSIYLERTAKRGPLWRRIGARGQLVNMRTCVERLWNQFFNISDSGLEELDIDVDDALDLINYTVFLVLCLRKGNRDGEWTW